MYENPSPYLLVEPSGTLDTRDVQFTAISARRVRVEGSRFIEAEQRSVKLEGVRCIGFRTMTLGVTRDPALITHADDYVLDLERTVAERVLQTFGAPPPQYELHVRQIGRNSAMGAFERTSLQCEELGLLISVIAPTQTDADAILAIARTHALHGSLVDRGGLLSNLAFPFAPTDVPTGPVHVFALNHVIFPASSDGLFAVAVERM
jgi:hypothetical protein